MAASTGGRFTSLTTIWIVSLTLAMPSLTRIVSVFALGPWASVGVQENTPPGVMLAPAGAP